MMSTITLELSGIVLRDFVHLNYIQYSKSEKKEKSWQIFWWETENKDKQENFKTVCQGGLYQT